VSIILKIDKGELEKSYEKTVRSFGKLAETDLIVKRGQALYPELLAKTKEAPPFLFMRGNIEIVHQSIVAVVGSRQPSEDGAKKASILASLLGKHRIVVASGLARGIDTAAHLGALNNGFLTITVIGTPLSKVYPKENAYLQKLIGEKGLVISQFPPSAEVQRWNFPMRNAIMSGISLATVVVEAGETSGALKQADYALKQGRIVFIPQSAIENPKLKWPRNYMKRPGAKNFSKIDELIIELENSKVITNEKTKEKATTQVTLFDEETGTHYAN
ncbi:MAG TPA: DNA-processing protein DprA, partial [Clostridium sp.]